MSKVCSHCSSTIIKQWLLVILSWGWHPSLPYCTSNTSDASLMKVNHRGKASYNPPKCCLVLPRILTVFHHHQIDKWISPLLWDRQHVLFLVMLLFLGCLLLPELLVCFQCVPMVDHLKIFKQYVLSKFWSIWFLKGGQEHWTPTFKADLPGPQISGLPPPYRVWSVKVPTTPCHAMEYHVIAENTSPYRVWTVKATVVETCLLHRSPDSIVGNMLGSILCRLTTCVTRIAIFYILYSIYILYSLFYAVLQPVWWGLLPRPLKEWGKRASAS